MATRSRRATIALAQFEHRARTWMSGVAVVGAAICLCFRAGLLSTSPVYERQSWYLVSEHAGFIVTSEADDEAACRKRETMEAVCHSGSSLADRRP